MNLPPLNELLARHWSNRLREIEPIRNALFRQWKSNETEPPSAELSAVNSLFHAINWRLVRMAGRDECPLCSSGMQFDGDHTWICPQCGEFKSQVRFAGGLIHGLNLEQSFAP